ncbi:T9SS type A sorting domain-containing protein [Croceimicrobium sp.]|uniref:T9SS type A sorting domain-containing protein n=1 Tax=Croceimicrobium sp. TaxID=2828340 RepID=UPI003BA9669B
MKKVLCTLAFVSALLNFNSQAQSLDQSLSGSISSQQDEGEAHIAMDPNDSTHLVVGYMELGTSLSFRIYHSEDQGNTWRLSQFDPSSEIANDFPGFIAAGGGDILFAYDNNHNLYCSWIYLLFNPSAPNPTDTLVFVGYWGKSTDNGHSFSLEAGEDHYFGIGKLNASQTIYNYKDGICDRQWMAVDLSNGPGQNDLYIGYINFPADLNQTGLKVKVKKANQSSFSAATTAYSGNGQFTNLAMDSNGKLHYSFADFMNNEILYTSSTDGAQTFSTPVTIQQATTVFPSGTGVINERENAAPSLAVDGQNNLHLVWADFISNQNFESYYSRSTDNGATWSTPLDLTTIFGSKVFMPVVSAHGDKVSIGGNVLDSTNKSNYHISNSQDNGANFGPIKKVSSGTTNFAQVSKSRFVGDYSSSVRTHCNIYSLWTDCRANGCKQYIAKYDECASLGIEYTPIEAPFSLSTLYPNPVSTVLNLDMKSDAAMSLNLEIFDLQGRVVYSSDQNLLEGKNKLELDLSSLKAGQYLLSISDANGTFISRNILKN